MSNKNTTIDDNTLALYYYDDGLSDEERARVGKAILQDDLQAARYARLCCELDGMKESAAAPAPEHLKHQWHALIEQQAQLERQKQSKARKPRSFLIWGGALASMLVVGIAIGTFLKQQSPTELPELIIPSATNSSVTPVAFQRGVQAYLEDRQGDLTRIKDHPSDRQSLLLMQIVAQNRIFEQVAESNNAPEIARVMRAFEPILLQLAADDISPEDAETLHRQLEFEFRAMLTKNQQSASKEAQTI